MFNLSRIKTKSKIPALLEAIADGAKEAIKDVIEDVYQGSQRIVPVDTGALKASGEKSFDNDGLKGEVSYGTDHCVHVEFGTSKMAAQPYLRPAAESATKRLGQRANKIRSAIKRSF